MSKEIDTIHTVFEFSNVPGSGGTKTVDLVAEHTGLPTFRAGEYWRKLCAGIIDYLHEVDFSKLNPETQLSMWNMLVNQLTDPEYADFFTQQYTQKPDERVLQRFNQLTANLPTHNLVVLPEIKSIQIARSQSCIIEGKLAVFGNKLKPKNVDNLYLLQELNQKPKGLVVNAGIYITANAEVTAKRLHQRDYADEPATKAALKKRQEELSNRVSSDWRRFNETYSYYDGRPLSRSLIDELPNVLVIDTSYLTPNETVELSLEHIVNVIEKTKTQFLDNPEMLKKLSYLQDLYAA